MCIRDSGKPWASEDAARSGYAGNYLPCRTAVVFIKGDWAEYSATLGFPTHADGLRPCFKCVAFGGDRFDHLGHSPLGLGWDSNGEDDYFDACSRCEFNVEINEHSKRIVSPCLRYDKSCLLYTSPSPRD